MIRYNDANKMRILPLQLKLKNFLVNYIHIQTIMI